MSTQLSYGGKDVNFSMDGAVVPIQGEQRKIKLQVWKTSTLNKQLLAWYNALKADRDAGGVSNRFVSTVTISYVDGSTDIVSGVAPLKEPIYQEQAQRVTWILERR